MPSKEGHPEQGLHGTVALLAPLHDVDIYTEELPATFNLRFRYKQTSDPAIS